MPDNPKYGVFTFLIENIGLGTAIDVAVAPDGHGHTSVDGFKTIILTINEKQAVELRIWVKDFKKIMSFFLTFSDILGNNYDQKIRIIHEFEYDDGWYTTSLLESLTPVLNKSRI